uniref:Uncharacterized protein n=1 Tax=Glossina brevipalpis TaxID=37001 RepID=A0A1A9X2P6_9MUSC
MQQLSGVKIDHHNNFYRSCSVAGQDDVIALIGPTCAFAIRTCRSLGSLFTWNSPIYPNILVGVGVNILLILYYAARSTLIVDTLSANIKSFVYTPANREQIFQKNSSFIGNGNFMSTLMIREKYKFMPPHVFECVWPSTTVKSPHCKWTDESKEILQKCAIAGRVEIEVFSVVYGVTNVIIEMQNGVVQIYFARKREENYLSRTDQTCVCADNCW